MWMRATELTGVYLQHNIWAKDPPVSLYPACIDIKCAALQSADAAEKYLFLLLEACMIKGQNIAKQSVLFKTSSLLENEFQFNIEYSNKIFLALKGEKLFAKICR